MRRLFALPIFATTAILFLLAMGNTYASVPWTFSNTGINHTVFIPINSVTVDGQSLATGDVIGVFYLKSNTLYCGGYTVISNPSLNVTLTAWGDDPATSTKDGFAQGEEFVWKVFKNSGNTQYFASANYSGGLPNQQYFETNGMSGLSSLIAETSVFPWSYSITMSNHVILVTYANVTISGQQIESGDVVGIFYEDNGVQKCGGYLTIDINSSPINSAITAWGDDTGNSNKNGFDPGETFSWKILKASSGIIYEAEAEYMPIFPNDSTYEVNGMSGLSSLSTTSSSITWTYTKTGNNHTIYVPMASVLINGQNLNSGDIVGVFYSDGAEIKCGGYSTITNPTPGVVVTAWGDESGTSVKDGFAIGEAFQWKIFRHSENQVYDAMPVYNYTFAHGGNYVVNGLSGLASLVTTNNSLQSVLLMQGWSMISTYIDPADNHIENLFQSVMSDLILFKDGSGGVFWPLFGVNMIDSLTIGKGYQVKMQTTDSVFFSGSMIIPDNTSITIPAGWSILGYLRQVPGALSEVMSAVGNQIIICKNDNGLVYWPQYNVNTIGDMLPSEGYLIKMSSSVSFTFPSNQNTACAPQPSIANAGPDQLSVVLDSVILAANIPTSGSGEWSIISGVGGVLFNPTSNSSTFSGDVGEVYQLVWTVSTNCGSHSDTVQITFYNQLMFECGLPWIDVRDGQWYNTMQIGTQCWMAENLNYGTFVHDSIEQSNNSMAKKYCYASLPANCETLGGLYRWGELMEYSSAEGVQGLCPSGWHVPSDAEWYQLENLVDNTIADPSTVGFRGTDAASKLLTGGTSGLNLIFGGVYAGNGNYYGMNPSLPNFTYYATSTEYSTNINKTWYRGLHQSEAGVNREPDSKYYSTSVRCLADNTTSCDPMPSQANAGADRFAINSTSLLLNASTPQNGNGQWSVVQGTGAVVADLANPSSLFSGNLGEDYLLAWTVANYCGATSDTVMVSFLNDTNLVCGGLLPDMRDISLYQTIQVGNQCWMAENLNYGTFLTGTQDPSNNGIAEKYCYNNDENNCVSMGGMYRWNELMEYSTAEFSQGLCPEGWHIPSDAEWFVLENHLDTSINDALATGFRGVDAGLKSKVGGSSGMEIQWAGIYAGNNNFYGVKTNIPHYGYYATSTENLQNVNKVWLRVFHESENGVMRDFDSKYYAGSVRCLANKPNPCFAQPTAANAGPNQTNVIGTSAQLAANQPLLGTGTWTLLQGINGTISDTSDPASSFTGSPGESYLLKWSIANYCGSSSDTVSIHFFADTAFACGGSLVDIRDNQTYNTIAINGECWMAQNLNYGTFVTSTQGQLNNATPEKYCYADNTANCTTMGGLYTWDEMMQYDTLESSQGLCPMGWHVPSDTEWHEMENFLDSSVNDPTTTGFRGIEIHTKLFYGGSSGLNLIYSGTFYQPNLSFYGSGSINRFANYATSAQILSTVWIRSITEAQIGVSRTSESKLLGNAVRCVKDTN